MTVITKRDLDPELYAAFGVYQRYKDTALVHGLVTYITSLNDFQRWCSIADDLEYQHLPPRIVKLMTNEVYQNQFFHYFTQQYNPYGLMRLSMTVVMEIKHQLITLLPSIMMKMKPCQFDTLFPSCPNINFTTAVLVWHYQLGLVCPNLKALNFFDPLRVNAQ